MSDTLTIKKPNLLNNTIKIFFLFLISSNALEAQNSSRISQLEDLSAEYNLPIQNQSKLTPFFKKLDSLEKGLIDRVSIIHIGDSHLQAGFSSNEVRKILQRNFGNAGQGLVFPYKLANSNSPVNSYSYSNIEWESFRNLHEQDKYKIGIKGYVVATKDSSAILKLSVKPNDSLDYSFNKVTVFHPEAAQDYQYRISQHNNREVLEESTHDYKEIIYKVKRGDFLGKIALRFGLSVQEIKRLNRLKSDRIYENQELIVKKKERSYDPINSDEFKTIMLSRKDFKYHSETILDTLVSFIFIDSIQTKSKAKPFQIDGIVLEKLDAPGILYHMIGVNGAMYSDYNSTDLFFKQLPVLKPDLVIVSLGTNEVANERQEIYKDMSLFFEKLKQTGSTPFSILITTPIDYKRKKNLVYSIANQVKNYAERHELAYYNQYDVFGGKGSIQLLQKRKLAQRDGIHLTAMGYKLQGYMLALSLLESFKNQTVD